MVAFSREDEVMMIFFGVMGADRRASRFDLGRNLDVGLLAWLTLSHGFEWEKLRVSLSIYQSQ